VRKLPEYGEIYGSSEDPSFITDDGVELWMYRQGRRVRFFDRNANQLGREHANVYQATVWAYTHGWYSPSAPAWVNAGCAAEVHASTLERLRATAKTASSPVSRRQVKLLGISEIAEAVGVSRGTVAQWHRRGRMPKPDASLKCGPIWFERSLSEWLESRR
jgi:predicted DNA-binding transcriptional regulator AlpA